MLQKKGCILDDTSLSSKQYQILSLYTSQGLGADMGGYRPHRLQPKIAYMNKRCSPIPTSCVRILDIVTQFDKNTILAEDHRTEHSSIQIKHL